jgi:2-keto-4-pentenoate hydratase
VFGHIFSSELFRTGARVDHQRFDRLAVEGEFALRLARDIPDAGWLRENWKKAVSAVFPVIELHNYVFRAGKPTAQELIASNALHAGVVLPVQEHGLDDWGDLLAEPITVSRNGEELGTSSGNGVPGGPVASLIELAEQLAEYEVSLKSGELILSGSPLPLYPVSAGDRIEVHAPRLGNVTLTVE